MLALQTFFSSISLTTRKHMTGGKNCIIFNQWELNKWRRKKKSNEILLVQMEHRQWLLKGRLPYFVQRQTPECAVWASFHAMALFVGVFHPARIVWSSEFNYMITIYWFSLSSHPKITRGKPTSPQSQSCEYLWDQKRGKRKRSKCFTFQLGHNLGSIKVDVTLLLQKVISTSMYFTIL